MTANYVADLMGGNPGPVPADIAREAYVMRAVGHTPDQISDVLGDKLQARRANPLYAMGGKTRYNVYLFGTSIPLENGATFVVGPFVIKLHFLPAT